MSIHLSRSKIIAIGAVAFVAGVFFASSMDWTRILGAQGKLGGRSALVSNGALEDSQNAFVSVAEHVTPAVVSVSAERTTKPQDQRDRIRQLPPEFQQFFDQPQQPRTQEVGGSGFIVSKDGYILTNNHVVENADRVSVTLLDHRTFKAKVVGHDPQTDVAVLKIDASDLTAVPLGDDSKTRVGEWALAIGNPFGLDFTVTAGIISAKGRNSPQLRDLNGDNYAIQDFIQTDAAINPGNSGGPLVNIRGEVVGINSAIASETGSYSGYGFAIPITLAKTVMDDLIAHGHVRRAILGAAILDLTPEDAAAAKLKDIAGVKIESFTDGSPAEKAGMEPGDIVIKIDGKPADRVSTLQRMIRTHQPGDVVDLEVVRYGDHKDFKVKLIEAPTATATVASNSPAASGRSERPAPAAPATVTVPKLGIVLQPITPDVVRGTSFSGAQQGMVVRSVEPGSVSDNKLLVGSIITGVIHPEPRTTIKTAADLEKVLAKLNPGDIIGLVVAGINTRGEVQTSIVNIRIGN
jgi:serine protease Do